MPKIIVLMSECGCDCRMYEYCTFNQIESKVIMSHVVHIECVRYSLLCFTVTEFIKVYTKHTYTKLSI